MSNGTRQSHSGGNSGILLTPYFYFLERGVFLLQAFDAARSNRCLALRSGGQGSAPLGIITSHSYSVAHLLCNYKDAFLWLS